MKYKLIYRSTPNEQINSNEIIHIIALDLVFLNLTVVLHQTINKNQK